MRVIGGKFRGKSLFSPTDKRVRPTTDRIKETLFNVLYSKGASYGSVLDLFSGSGALGIEALSRGAKTAVFVDRSHDSALLTQKNLQKVGADGCEVYRTDYTIALRKLCGRKFDLIFSDPPYALGIEPTVIELVEKYELLSDGGILVLEHFKGNSLQIDGERFIIDERLCGQTVLSFLSKAHFARDE